VFARFSGPPPTSTDPSQASRANAGALDAKLHMKGLTSCGGKYTTPAHTGHAQQNGHGFLFRPADPYGIYPKLLPSGSRVPNQDNPYSMDPHAVRGLRSLRADGGGIWRWRCLPAPRQQYWRSDQHPPSEPTTAFENAIAYLFATRTFRSPLQLHSHHGIQPPVHIRKVTIHTTNQPSNRVLP
jgi:hypothetical protein